MFLKTTVQSLTRLMLIIFPFFFLLYKQMNDNSYE